MPFIHEAKLSEEKFTEYQEQLKTTLETGKPPPKPKQKPLGDTVYPPCVSALHRLDYAMEECEKYTMADFRELVIGYGFLYGHTWIIQKRFSQYRDWLSQAAAELEPLVDQIKTPETSVKGLRPK